MSETANVLECLIERFRQAEQTECAACDGTTWTYGRLLREIAEDQARLVKDGAVPGDVVVTAGAFGLRQLALFFALSRLGAITVPLPAINDTETAKCAEVANAAWVATVTSDGRWTLKSTGYAVTNALLREFRHRNEPGLVVFTSGSTGEKKAILHSVPKLLRKYITPRKTYRTLSFLKWDHMGGINTVLYAFSNLGMVVFPRSRSVEEICALIREHRIQLLPTTPSFLNLLLLSRSDLEKVLSSVELITYGTEVMPEQTLRRVRDTLPTVVLQQTYGLSELGVLRSKSMASDSLFVKVGGPGFEWRVVNGTLWIRADSAMEGYLNCPSPFTADGWYDTGDKVEVRDEYLKFLGRETDVINVGGEKVLPGEVENFLLGLANVRDAAVSSEPNALLGHIVVAQVVLAADEPQDQAASRLKAACREGLRRFMVPVKISFVSELPYSDRFKKMRASVRPA